jgi:hypothetical protein
VHEFQYAYAPTLIHYRLPVCFPPRRRVVQFDGEDDAMLLPFMANVAAVSLWLRLELPEDMSPLPDTHTLLHLQAPAALVGSDAVGALWSVFYVDGEPIALPGASAPTIRPLFLSPTTLGPSLLPHCSGPAFCGRSVHELTTFGGQVWRRRLETIAERRREHR